jgi:hypothetical protein
LERKRGRVFIAIFVYDLKWRPVAAYHETAHPATADRVTAWRQHVRMGLRETQEHTVITAGGSRRAPTHRATPPAHRGMG